MVKTARCSVRNMESQNVLKEAYKYLCPMRKHSLRTAQSGAILRLSAICCFATRNMFTTLCLKPMNSRTFGFREEMANGYFILFPCLTKSQRHYSSFVTVNFCRQKSMNLTVNGFRLIGVKEKR